MQCSKGYKAGVAGQVSEFLFGDGFAITSGDNWRVRRKAVGPALHRAYLEKMVDGVFGPSARHLAEKLEVVHNTYTCTASLISQPPSTAFTLDIWNWKHRMRPSATVLLPHDKCIVRDRYIVYDMDGAYWLSKL